MSDLACCQQLGIEVGENATSQEYRERTSRTAIYAAIAQRTVASRQEWGPRAVSNQPTPALLVTR